MKEAKRIPPQSTKGGKLIQAGISMNQITDQLEIDGIQLFTEPYDRLVTYDAVQT